jgi:hypothetical protein
MASVSGRLGLGRAAQAAGLMAVGAALVIAGAGPAAASGTEITGDGSNGNPFTTDNQCTDNDGLSARCNIDFVKNVDEDMPWGKGGTIPAYKCPTGFPYLRNASWPGYSLMRGMESKCFAPTIVSV